MKPWHMLIHTIYGYILFQLSNSMQAAWEHNRKHHPLSGTPPGQGDRQPGGVEGQAQAPPGNYGQHV